MYSYNGFLISLLFVKCLFLEMMKIGNIVKTEFIDNIIRVFAFVGVSAPNFWLGFLLIMLFSVKFDLLPPFGDEGFSSLLMPGFAIAYMSIAINTRLIRANMLEIFSARHVLYAKMRGLSKFRIIFAHVFKNALIPVITAIGMHVGELIGGALVVENVFAYPGLGRWAIEAIANNDYPIIQAFILIMAFAFIVGNLAYYGIGIALAFYFKDNRAFCKYICPITIFLKPMSYFSLLRIRCDKDRCIDCGKCKRICPMNVDVTDNSRKRANGTECILCMECVKNCPKDAL